MKYLLFPFLIICAILPFRMTAQSELSHNTENKMHYYPQISLEEYTLPDSLQNKIVNKIKTEQVTSICGVPVGSSRSVAIRALRNKFGENYFQTADSTIMFENVIYGGLKFDIIIFGFQSDGFNSFLNFAVFVIHAKNKSNANEIIDSYRKLLSKRYNLVEEIDDLGFKTYVGGISPLWDGSYQDLMRNNMDYQAAVHTDVLAYNYDAYKEFGGQFGIRLIYGPYIYVKEEF